MTPKLSVVSIKKGSFFKNQHLYHVSTQSFQQNLVCEPQNLFFFFPYRVAVAKDRVYTINVQKTKLLAFLKTYIVLPFLLILQVLKS